MKVHQHGDVLDDKHIALTGPPVLTADGVPRIPPKREGTAAATDATGMLVDEKQRKEAEERQAQQQQQQLKQQQLQVAIAQAQQRQALAQQKVEVGQATVAHTQQVMNQSLQQHALNMQHRHADINP